MERSKDYQEGQRSICITEGIFFLLWTPTDSGTGASNRRQSDELGPMQVTLGVEEVWGTTWGCSPAAVEPVAWSGGASAGGGGRNRGHARGSSWTFIRHGRRLGVCGTHAEGWRQRPGQPWLSVANMASHAISSEFDFGDS
jgi:hypothetical protein